MKKILKSNPIISFIILTFTISLPLDCASIWFEIPKDIIYSLGLIATISPLIAGLIMVVNISDCKIKIGSRRVFYLAGITSIILLTIRMVLANDSMESKITPTLQEVSILGFVLLGIHIFLISINSSNSNNNELKENYIKTFLYNSKLNNWYLIALLLVPIIFIISYFSGQLLGLEVDSKLFKIEWHWPISFLMCFLLMGAMEEFGWRGFLQKEMQKKYNPLITAFILAILWYLWHLPLYYNGLYSTGGISDSLDRFFFTIPATIIINWLYNKTNYSILAVMLLHVMYDETALALGHSMEITFILMTLFSVYCIVSDKMWKKKSVVPISL